MDVPPPPFVPPPEINIATPPPQHAITVQDKAPTPPPVVRTPPTIALKVSGRGCRPPEYPAISNRLGETGSVVLRMLVGVNGTVTDRSEEHTSELQSLMRISYAVFCLNKNISAQHKLNTTTHSHS